jgi:hypothetical protein
VGKSTFRLSSALRRPSDPAVANPADGTRLVPAMKSRRARVGKPDLRESKRMPKCCQKLPQCCHFFAAVYEPPKSMKPELALAVAHGGLVAGWACGTGSAKFHGVQMGKSGRSPFPPWVGKRGTTSRSRAFARRHIVLDPCPEWPIVGQLQAIGDSLSYIFQSS